MKVVSSSTLRTGRLYPQEFSWYSFLETVFPAEHTYKLDTGLCTTGHLDMCNADCSHPQKSRSSVNKFSLKAQK